MSKKDLWKGKQYFYNDAVFLGQDGTRNSEFDAQLLSTIMKYDIYQSGFTYTIAFDNNIRKINVALAALTNFHKNPFSCEGLVDSISLYIVDNELEKDLVKPFLDTFATDAGIRYCTNVQELNFCGAGLLLITLDELPEAIVKLSELNKKRNQCIAELLNHTKIALEKTGYVEREIKRLPAQLVEKIIAWVEKADLFNNQKIESKTLFNIHEQAEAIQSFASLDTAVYQTKHVQVLDFGDNEDTNTEVEYNYTAFPVGVVFVHNGDLYNDPDYFGKRKYLLDFLKPLIPNYFY